MTLNVEEFVATLEKYGPKGKILTLDDVMIIHQNPENYKYQTKRVFSRFLIETKTTDYGEPAFEKFFGPEYIELTGNSKIIHGGDIHFKVNPATCEIQEMFDEDNKEKIAKLAKESDDNNISKRYVVRCQN